MVTTTATATRRSPRRSTRRQDAGTKTTSPASTKKSSTTTSMKTSTKASKSVPAVSKAISSSESNQSKNSDLQSPPRKYIFEGVEYETYQEMVNAKRQRNQQVLRDSGLLDISAQVKTAAATQQKQQQQRGIKRKSATASLATLRKLPPRKSNRIAGIASDGMYVEDERAGKFTVVSDQKTIVKTSPEDDENDETKQQDGFFRNRINDGADITVKEAVEHIGAKWLEEDSVQNAESFVRDCLAKLPGTCDRKLDTKKKLSPTSILGSLTVEESLTKQVHTLQVDDAETCVAKVVPDRIYGIAAHPSSDGLIVCAGDKQGYIGIWNVDSRSENDSNVHLFRYHGGAASCLQWTPSGSALFSTSYDGSVRWFDVASEKLLQVFATYDDSAVFKDKLGYDLDTGYNYWTQYGCLDNRFQGGEQCFFVTTSTGCVMHVDLRSKGKLTFVEQLSEKKVNTVSLHPNGNSFLSAGLDCMVHLWDLRKFGGSGSASKHPKAIHSYHAGKSVNSAYFSPSGKYVVSTTMANTLDVSTDYHINKKQVKRIRHDNMTGRWLSTFMASWHPAADLFCCGAMKHPRVMEVYSPEEGLLRAIGGDAMTAVASRICFHPSTDKLILVGGNSSGRVTIAR